MNNILKIEDIANILACCPKTTDGWVNSCYVGPQIKGRGVDYKSSGFKNLREYLGLFGAALEFKVVVPEGKTVPVAYVRMANASNSSAKDSLAKPRDFVIPKPFVEVPKIKLDKDPRPALFKWAFCGLFESMIEKLANIAMPESWIFKNSDKTNQILKNYLIFTFEKVLLENKIYISSDGQSAIFNTGLLDTSYLPIYALFTAIEPEQGDKSKDQHWTFANFVVDDEANKELLCKFLTLPPAAKYIARIGDVFYETKFGAPICDSSRIIADKIDRLPMLFIKKFVDENFCVKDIQSLEVSARAEYLEELNNYFKTNTEAFEKIKAELDCAIKLAFNKVCLNYRTAVPMYSHYSKKMCFLLPLNLANSQITDAALVIAKDNFGKHYGQAILPLSWAYIDARLVGKVDSSWLNIDSINSEPKA